MGVKKFLKAGFAAALVTAALSGCSSVHEPQNLGPVTRTNNPQILAELAYAKAHYKNPNTAEFGNLGGTDCVNFTSQTLLARGWKMTTEWSHSNQGDPYTRAWISSTAFHDYLKAHPQLGAELDWNQRSRVSVGDVVQFDWDASGDRDHTGIISGIATIDGKRTLLVASHSPAAYDWPITDVLAEHGHQTKVYFWHLR
ncbi:MAG: amidase domain-containing protein [Micrococcales bacterium]